MRPFFRSLSVAAFLLGTVAAAGAFSFDPMSVTFDPAGAGSVRSFRLKNDGTSRIAVRVEVVTRESLEDGTETNKPIEDGLFVVFPSRFVLEAKSSRLLKVQWKGGDPGERERAFRIVAEQVPVQFEERKGSGISLLFKYMGAVYVRPASPSVSDVGVVSAIGREREGKRGIELRLSNRGGTHCILVGFKLSLVSSTGLSTGLPESALMNVEGNNILAGTERVFFIPHEQAEVGVSYDARITFTPQT